MNIRECYDTIGADLRMYLADLAVRALYRDSHLSL